LEDKFSNRNKFEKADYSLDTVGLTGDVFLVDRALAVIGEDVLVEDDEVLDKLVDKVLILNLMGWSMRVLKTWRRRINMATWSLSVGMGTRVGPKQMAML
jgi:hypothetical protein